MNQRIILPLLLVLVWTISCKNNEMLTFSATHPQLAWQGRTFADDESGQVYLIGSAASLKFRFSGKSCRLWLRNVAPPMAYNYISFVVDGERKPRQKVDFDSLTLIEIIPTGKKETHDIELYKETEASCGHVLIEKIETEGILDFPSTSRKKIEFIGNSITVGMSSDESMIPCESGTWYDQHNAYDAYGPRVARALNMDYMISGVSGIGIYRNTRADSPVMSDLYESAFLSPEPRSPRWDFKSFIPDIVSVCLGTNDFSDGDGVMPRLPFDSTKFIQSYMDFLKMVHQHYPNAGIVITNSPMLDIGHNQIFMECLLKIQTRAKAEMDGLKSISLFSFSRTYNSGCYGHPSTEEQGKMAEEMILFLSEMK